MFAHDAKNVQDLAGTDVFDDRMRDLLAVVAFAFAGTVSPGPNNTLLWASGMRFGFLKTLPHVVGTVIGMGALIVAVSLGLGALLHAVPQLELGLKIVGSLYLLYVAYLVAGSGAIGRAEAARPLGLWRGALFQWTNPKAWVFVVAAVGTFIPEASTTSAAAFLVVVSIVVAVSSTTWAAGGTALGRLVTDDRRRRIASVVLAVLLVLSIALIWI
jgi:threonine/homoserine/homoserine lactone efflux protein